MTTANAERRWSSSSNRTESSKFPDLEPSISREYLPTHEEEGSNPRTSGRDPSPNTFTRFNNNLQSDKWLARKDTHVAWGDGSLARTPPKHGRQKSLSDAIRTIRTRKGSILCLVWYMSSALTNTSSKSILNAFPQPITLTVIQFACVSSWCMFLAFVARVFPPLQRAVPVLKHGIRYPTRDVIATTLPLAMFQIGGHILSSTATEQIPVSLVHTIKGLSPLFTVLAYRFIFHIHYTTATYLSLIPLTLGVVLACSVEFSGNLFGILCALSAAVIFVTQNIFSKKLFNEAALVEAEGPLPPSSKRHQKLDKLNLLCYCSGLAFILTCPVWLWMEGLPILSSPILLTPFPASPSHAITNLPLEFFFNGIFHFGQNILAFVLLSMVSPVTYSVASLIKRVFVIVVAIVWFGNRTTRVQAAGIALTFFGLYLYDRTSGNAKADRRAKLEQLRIDAPILPLTNNQPLSSAAIFTETPLSAVSGMFGGANGFVTGDEKKHDAAGPGRPKDGFPPPGARVEDFRDYG
ncbi:MAG: hypothetical protein LQ342_004675 [Letrouitia transgressa]|nr:MAG: hypothetical protein LQ342_004675 [Letrouitia transgressa]